MKNNLIKKVLNNTINTEYGKKYSVSSINDYTDFKKQLPIVTYEDLYDFIDLQFHKDCNYLLNSPPIYWNLTSGHSALPKKIPVTKESLQSYLTGIAPLFKNVFSSFGELLFQGKILPLVGRYEVNKSPQGISIGTISGLLMKTAAKDFHKYFACDLNYADSLSPNDRWNYVTNNSIDKDIRCIFAANPAFITKILEIGLKERFGLDIYNIKDGYILWPNLKVVICQTGGACSYHINKLKRYFPDTIFWDGGIGSSEGYFGCSDFQSKPIAKPVDSEYIIEYKEFGKNDSNVILYNDLKENVNYELIVSSNNGLLRYNTHDIVKKAFNGTIEFIGRQSLENSFVGERLTELQIEEAANKLLFKYNLAGDYFMVADKSLKKYTLNIVIPNEQYPNLKNAIDTINKDFDLILQKININYKYAREQYKVLDIPEVNFIKESEHNYLFNSPNPVLQAQEKPKHLLVR